MKIDLIQQHIFSDKTVKTANNFMFSPVSFQILLTTLLPGTSGKIREEVLALLGITEAEAVGFWDQMVALPLHFPNDKESLIVQSANSLWHRPIIDVDSKVIEIELQPDFLTKIKSLQVEYFEVPKNTGQFKNEVNHWVNQKTKGLISQIPFAPTKYHALTFLNVLYFKGKWEIPFSPLEDKIPRGKFYLGDGNQVKCHYLSKEYINKPPTEALSYLEGQSFQLLSLPYKHPNYSMDILLPGPKVHPLKAWEEVKTIGLSALWDGLKKPKSIKLEIPKFEFEFNLDIKTWLLELGFPKLFKASKTDFGPLIKSLEPFKISQIKQTSRIRVNEKGTEAAAVMRMDIDIAWGQPSKPLDHIRFIANRPFFFFIRDKKRGEILFQGFLGKPEAGAFPTQKKKRRRKFWLFNL